MAPTWRPSGDLVKVDVLAELLAAGVHLQDLHAPGHVRPVHSHLPVKAPRPKQGRVQHLQMAGPSVQARSVHKQASHMVHGNMDNENCSSVA